MNGMMNAFFVASSVWIPSLRSLTFAAICDTASLNSMIIALLLFLSVWLLIPWRFRLKFLVLVLIRGQTVQIGIRRDIIGDLRNRRWGSELFDKPRVRGVDYLSRINVDELACVDKRFERHRWFCVDPS